MIKLPTPPSEAGNILDWAEEVQAYLEGTQPRSSADLLLDSGPGGTGFKFRRKVHIPRRRLHPFEGEIIATDENSEGDVDTVTLAINPQSTLLKSDQWNDVAVITHFSDEQSIGRTGVSWLECLFDGSGDLVSVERKSGAPWATFPDMLKDNGDGTFTWYQLLCYFRPSRERERRDIRKFADHADPHTLINCTREHLKVSTALGSSSFSSKYPPLTYWAGGYETA